MARITPFRPKASFERGFTLIEVMVVISIIALLSSIVIAALKSAEASANDARTITELQSIAAAVESYYLSTGKLPDNFNNPSNCTQTSCTYTVQINGNAGTCDAPVPNLSGADISMPGTSPSNLDKGAWDATMQELVNAKIVDSIPESHSGSPGYCYYQFSGTPSNPIGGRTYSFALIVTVLQNAPLTTTGISPSVRPLSGTWNTQWCTPDSNRDYCLEVDAN